MTLVREKGSTPQHNPESPFCSEGDWSNNKLAGHCPVCQSTPSEQAREKAAVNLREIGS